MKLRPVLPNSCHGIIRPRHDIVINTEQSAILELNLSEVGPIPNGSLGFDSLLNASFFVAIHNMVKPDKAKKL